MKDFLQLRLSPLAHICLVNPSKNHLSLECKWLPLIYLLQPLGEVSCNRQRNLKLKLFMSWYLSRVVTIHIPALILETFDPQGGHYCPDEIRNLAQASLMF
jgi:hypothetical protein